MSKSGVYIISDAAVLHVGLRVRYRRGREGAGNYVYFISKIMKMHGTLDNLDKDFLGVRPNRISDWKFGLWFWVFS